MNFRTGTLAMLTFTGLAAGSLLTNHTAVRAQSGGAGRAQSSSAGPAAPSKIASAAAQSKGKRAVTFTHDIAPLLNENCASCHRPGQVAPFTLASYKDAQKRARQIALVTQSRQMPPWKLASHGEFQDERHLTDAQIALIKQWVEQGAVEGKPSDLPPAPHFAPDWTLGAPDMVAQPPADYKVSAEGRDVYRCFVVPTNFNEDRYVSAIDVHPGSRAIVHHIIAYIDTAGRARKLEAQAKDAASGPGYTTFGGIGFFPSGMLGGWAPGAAAHPLPADTGILLPKGADIVLEVHYHKDGKPETDRSQVALYFNKGEVDKQYHILPLVNMGLHLPAGEKDVEVPAGFPVPADVTLLSVFPHMHLLGRKMTVTATLPDGTTKPLVDVPDWDFNWQGFYYYKEPVKLPRGARVGLVAHYDNSSQNPRNPSSPPKDVRWGEQTTDEMCLCYLGFTVDAQHLHKNAAAGSAK